MFFAAVHFLIIAVYYISFLCFGAGQMLMSRYFPDFFDSWLT